MSRLTARLTLYGCGLLALLASSFMLAVHAEPSSATVRLRTALARAEKQEADAIPVLIDLLAELTPEQRQPVEELLTEWAGEWAPVLQLQSDDAISRRIRRDAWASWWRHADGPSLLAIIHKHTLNLEARAHALAHIAQLGEEQFAVREHATKELLILGRLILPQLREARASKDPKIARRVKLLIERIEREPRDGLPLAALRLLAIRKPAGAVETLLAYLPYAEDEYRIEGVCKSLTALARCDAKPNAHLLQALSDPQPLLRFTAATALAQGGGTEGRSAVRKLLKDDVPLVRLRVALALAAVKERDAIGVLIDLLAVLPNEQIGETESALYQLAGTSAPQTPTGTEPAERKKCRDAWAAWWKINAERVDLGRMKERPWYGYTVICENFKNRVYEIDRQGKTRWSIDNLSNPLEAVVLPNHRVLIAEHHGNRVTERDFKGNILWEKQVAKPVNVQRLPNGNTFIVSYCGPILEVDHAGKEVFVLPNVPQNVIAAYRARNGTIVCLTLKGECMLLDKTGKRLKSFAIGHGDNTVGSVDPSAHGRILVTRAGSGKVAEYDVEGKRILEVDAPQATKVTGLPNGHILVACSQGRRVYELNRAGKIVWEHTCPDRVIWARRR